MTTAPENIDRQLLKRLKGGDMNAFQLVFAAYSQNLLHFTFSYLKDQYEAEEIVQDVFLRIWEIRKDIDEEKSFKSFIYRMTVNKVFNHLKHQVVRKKYEAYLSQSVQSFDESPEARLHYQELEEKIRGILQKLPEQQRNIFQMSRMDGLSNSEISDKLELSIRTVENQIYRANKFLKEQMKNEYLYILFFLSAFL
ncbi:RNA polymerase sigma factor [Gaoshiqia sp. Z1-71]|uniref:RNA polymerase sigma factor n=1 Tax=Gaoshiqia hydrogeniformans TaxID=3290090 RepID=UPI003BF82B16